MMRRSFFALCVFGFIVIITMAGLAGCTRAKPGRVALQATETPPATLTPAPPSLPATRVGITALPTETPMVPIPVSPTFTPEPFTPTFVPSIPTLTPTPEIQPPAPLTPAWPTETPIQPLPSPTATPVPGPGTTYIVQPGDTLYSIAIRFNTTIKVIAQANGIYNPSFIYVGQRLIIPGGEGQFTPAPGGERIHIVGPGENLFRIALRYNTTINAIARANGIVNPRYIYVGQRLIIP